MAGKIFQCHTEVWEATEELLKAFLGRQKLLHETKLSTIIARHGNLHLQSEHSDHLQVISFILCASFALKQAQN